MPWAEVDDLTQQGILVALELRPHYQPERGVPFHLFVKPRVFGSMIDMLRHASTLGRNETAYMSTMEDQEDVESAVDILVKVENAEILAEAIDQLPSDERTVISLFYLEELTNKEVAETVGISEVKAVRLRNRALNLLSESVAQRLGDVPQQSGKTHNMPGVA